MKLTTTAEVTQIGDEIVFTMKMDLKTFVKLAESLKQMKPAKQKTVVTAAPDLKAKKTAFSNLIKEFANKNPALHPKGMYNQFYAYWAESTKSGKNIRYEGEQYFDIGRRLATFRRNIKPEEMSKLWEADNKENSADKTLLNGVTKVQQPA